MIKNDIEKAIAKALVELGAEEAHFVVERPAEMEHGDYATNAALAAAKILKKNPKEVAELLAARFVSRSPSTSEDGGVGVHVQQTSLPAIERVEIAGAGFINFFLTREAIVQEVEAAASKKEWGSNNLYKGKKVMVEYTDPNPFKEFHIGHLMSNTIGESIARLLEVSGAKVLRANYQGDVGLHVAKAIWQLQNADTPIVELTDIGPSAAAYVDGSIEYEENPIAREEINEINRKIYEKSDDSINRLYESGRKVSLEHFEEIYKILGTKFDKYFFESETWQRGLELVKKNINSVFEESEGAIIYRGEQDGLHTRVFINKTGLPTYEAKDLGLLELKKEAGAFDVSITITASEQKEYFKVVLAAAKHIAEVQDIAQKTTHITHGMMRFAEGKMSSRTGNVITGESLLADLTQEAKIKMEDRKLSDTEKIAEQIAVGAIKYTVLRQGSGKDIIFDPAKSLSLEGDSGPYLQYAHTRALSLLKKTSVLELKLPSEKVLGGVSALERLLIHYPDVLAHAAEELEPHYVTTYLTELAAAFNSWYAAERVIGGEHERYGVLLAKAVEQTLAKGLQVLDIPAPEQM
ncbi:MAG TPA: arginine--tRNA ligase [Candidatus Paceibacterota bacterium]